MKKEKDTKNKTNENVDMSNENVDISNQNKEINKGDNSTKDKTSKNVNWWKALLKRNFIILALLALFLMVFNMQSLYNDSKIKKVSFSEVYDNYKQGNIELIKIEGDLLKVDLKREIEGGISKLESYKEKNFSVAENFDLDKVSIEVVDQSTKNIFWGIFSSFFPILLIFVFFIFMTKKMKGGGLPGGFMNDNKDYNKGGKTNVTFKDVAGAYEAKEDLLEVIGFLKNPKKYLKMGAEIPKGVMLYWLPGTGKTLLAKAVAGEANVPFYAMSGSEFEEMFVGVGAGRVRELFKKARKTAPSIIFIDEIDAVGRQRGGQGSTNYNEQTLNQILTEMDGFETGTNVIVMAATNRAEVLDKALLRPGRFDRRIMIDLPDIKEREEILLVHSKNKPFVKSIIFADIAKQTPGFSGADLKNLLNEAAIFTVKKNRKKITMNDVESSIEKVVMGSEKRNRVLHEKERRIVAYHEAGHAIVGYLLPNCDPVHKISIISRGQALGVTWFRPEEDRSLVSESKFKDEISSLLGGYLAEKNIFGEVTTGASNDLQKASEMSREMVMKYGMSEKIGTVVFRSVLEREGGYYGNATNLYSEETIKLVDSEVKRIIKEAYDQADQLLKKYNNKLELLAQKLLEVETVDKEEFWRLMEK